MEIALKTGRGAYRLREAAPAVRSGGATVLTLTLESANGIERVAFKCAIADNLALGDDSTAILARLAPWIEREFEMTREAALKSIRSERRMHEIVFDAANRGPF
ncbi:MAG: hypothetical protein WAU33_16955 [Candidatus Binataceae bacterium]